MPQVVIGAALATAAASAGAVLAGTAITTGFLLSTFAGSLILGGISYALTPKPKSRSVSQGVSKNTVAIRQSDLVRQFVYGCTRITRGYAHIESRDNNQNLHQILILCDGPVRAINEIWINDYCIPNDWIDSDGNVTDGRYAGHLTIRKHLGSYTQAADSLAVSNMSETWNSDCRLLGIAYLYIIMKKNQDVYPTGVPNITAIVEGSEVYDPRLDMFRWSPNIALMSHDYICNSRYGFEAEADETDPVNVSAQANICDEIVTTTDKNFSVVAVNSATDIVTIDGDILSLQYADRVRISSTGSLPGGLSADTDYYVIPYQIKDTPRLLLATTLDNSIDRIAVDITSAGSGSITITKTGEPRYHGGGVIDTETNLSENLNNLVTCMAGRAVCIGGFWTLFAGAWRTPTASFTTNDFAGSMGVKNALSMSQSYNTVKGTFVGPESFYQETDYPAAFYQTFLDQDNGLESPRDLVLQFTQRPTTAQRIAKIELFRGRQNLVTTTELRTTGMGCQPADNIGVTVGRYGWENKIFEITNFGFEIRNNSIVHPVSLRETAQEIFDWSAGEAIDFDPAPNTNLPNPFFVSAVTGLSYDSYFVETREGDAVYTLTLNWSIHADSFVKEYGDYEIQYKLSSEPDWRPSFFVDGSLTGTDVVSSSVNVYYDLRIRARNSLGVRSGWNYLYNAIVGSSGGATFNEDWGYVSDSPDTFLDYGDVDSSVTDNEDWGYV